MGSASRPDGNVWRCVISFLDRHSSHIAKGSDHRVVPTDRREDELLNFIGRRTIRRESSASFCNECGVFERETQPGDDTRDFEILRDYTPKTVGADQVRTVKI